MVVPTNKRTATVYEMLWLLKEEHSNFWDEKVIDERKEICDELIRRFNTGELLCARHPQKRCGDTSNTENINTLENIAGSLGSESSFLAE